MNGPIQNLTGWLLVASALAVAPSNPADAQQLFRWKFSPGQTLEVGVEQTTRTETSGAGKSTSIAIDMAMAMTWKVVSIDDNGHARMLQTFDRLEMSMSTDNVAPVVYDSAANQRPAGAARQIAAAMQPLLGAKFELTVTDRGQILDARIADTDAAEDAADERFQSPLSQLDISQTLAHALIVFAEQPVSAGDQWRHEREVESPLGKLAQTTTYQYAGPADHNGMALQRITMAANLELLQQATNSRTALKQQEATGVLWFDAEQGRLVESEVRQKLVTEQPYRDKHIRVQATSNMKTTIRSATSP